MEELFKECFAKVDKFGDVENECMNTIAKLIKATQEKYAVEYIKFPHPLYSPNWWDDEQEVWDKYEAVRVNDLNEISFCKWNVADEDDWVSATNVDDIHDTFYKLIGAMQFIEEYGLSQ